MITYKEFEVINTMLKAEEVLTNTAEYVYNNVHYYAFKNQEEVETLIEGLKAKQYITDTAVTELGLKEIETLRVKNAVILAAGGGDINAKSVYNMPKGLFMKNGETLIERQIRQLKEAGINDITVVVGYKQELYFFLVDKWGVNLEINTDLKKNNIYSLYIAKNFLGSTYILNCDNYFVLPNTNRFALHVFILYTKKLPLYRFLG